MSTQFKPPSCLSDNLVEFALQEGLKCKNIHVRNIVYSPGSAGGDNYCSDIIRAKVTYSKGGAVKTDLFLIIKCIQPSPETDLLVKMGVFDIEERMYSNVLLRVEVILQKSISPRCYFTCLKPTKTFFMDDLTYYGYKIGDRTKKLDLELAEIVMKHLGQYHAGSMVFAKQFPQEAKKLSKAPLFPTKKEDLNGIHFALFGKTFDSFLSLLGELPRFEGLLWKLKKLKDHFFDIAIYTYDNCNDNLRVINHGDFWINNIMFKFLKNKAIDVKFIDFQFSYYASPGLDLNYFFATSCQLEVLKNHQTELLKVYYKYLSETLKKLNFSPIPTWEDIRYEVYRKEFYGFVAFSTLSPIMSMDSQSSADNSFSNMGTEEKQKQIFQGKVFREMLDYCLDRYDKLGIFDL